MTTAPETAAQDTAVASADAAASQSQPDAASGEATTLLGAMDEWLSSLRAALARAVDITVLEARLAALNLAFILIIAVASGLLLATVWIAVFAAIAAWLHGLGLSWPLALLLIAAANLALAGAGGYAIYRMSSNLLFKTTRQLIFHGKADHDSAGSADGNPPPAP